MRYLKLIIILILLTNVIMLAAQNNPFTGKSSSSKSGSKIYKNSGLWHQIASWQKEINSKVNLLLKGLKNEFNLKYFTVLMLFSVLFGVIHAIGPGHGKMIVGTYFLKEKATSFTAVKIGSILAATHSGLAIVLGIIFGFLLKSIKMQGRAEMQSIISIAGGVLIALLGVYYLWNKLFQKEHHHQNICQNHGDNHLSNHLPNHLSKHNKKDKKSELLVGVFSGLVPCPISMTIILFSIYLDVFWYGLLSVIMFSVGMAGTVSMLGIITIKSRDLISKFSNLAPARARKWQKGFGVLTALFIIFIGVNIIIAQL